MAKAREQETVRPQPISSQGVGVDEANGDGEASRNGNGDREMEVQEQVEEMEVRPPKVARKPHAPTKAEIEAHYPLHAEYRDWCPHCVSGKGISAQHRKGDQEEEALGTTVSMDYMFAVPEEEDETMDAMLLIYDANRKNMSTLTVDKKGSSPAVVKWVMDRLLDAGYVGMQVTLKSDQEPAMVELKKEVGIRRAAETVMVESPVRESKSNGSVERAIRTWQGQFRTLRHQLEQRIGKKLKKGSAIMSWLVNFTSEVLSKYKVHSNGRTSYEMMVGHRCKQTVCGFAETVHFKTTTDKNRKNKMDTEWDIGIYIGTNPRTTEYLVHNETGIISCSTIRRMPDDKAYDPKCVELVSKSYRDYVCEGASSTNPKVRLAVSIPSLPDPAPAAGPIIPRRMRIKPSDLIKFGYTVGCPGCEALQSGSQERRNHIEACRTRIEKELEDSEEGRERLGRAKERVDQWTHDHTVAEAGVDAEETPITGGALGSNDPMTPPVAEEAAAEIVDAEVEMEVVEESIELQDAQAQPSDKRYATPSRNPATKRFTVATPEGMEVTVEDENIKVRRLDLQPEMNLDSLQVMTEEDKKIVASVILGVDITEVYSPERIAKVARDFGLKPGSSMDLTTGWDFTRSDHRRAAWKKVEEEDPYLLVGSPPCTWFSVLMELNVHVNRHNPAWQKKYEMEKAKAIQHVNFCCSLYERQLRRGKHFLHEHPWSARSWRLPKVEKLLDNPAVALTQGHMCQFGMETWDDKSLGTKGLVKKPTGFMTSSHCVLEELSRKCQGSHAHIPLVGGRAAGAAIYPKKLCEAVARAVIKQKLLDKTSQVYTGSMTRAQTKSFLHSLSPSAKSQKSINELCKKSKGRWVPIGDYAEHWFDGVHEDEGGDDHRGVRPQQGTEILKKEMNGLLKRGGEHIAWDDVTNAELDPEDVKEARMVEMAYFEKLGVYVRVPRSEIAKTGGKLIGVRWVDVNKGDASDRNYRSRLVGREFNVGKDESLYASTPPLEALRVVVSNAATEVPGEARREVIVCDVRRAYFYAKISRDVFIELPEEDPQHGGNLVGKLRLCLYGTRDAARSWQETLSLHLEGIGFKQGRGHPSVFHHPSRNIKALVHGDDYVASGSPEQLTWFKEELEKAYEIQSQRIGMGAGRQREGKVLNRILRCTEAGFEIEADPRHAELVIEQMNVAEDKGVATPGVSGMEEDDRDDDEELQGEQVRIYRAIAARLNYLSPDRPDALFAIKEGCREMHKPTTGSWRRMARVARFLKRRPRLVWRFDMQPEPREISVYTDADWAGCRRARKSTSGGAMMLGQHCVKVYSKTQAIIAKSSAESELYGVIKGSCEALGLQTLLQDLGAEIGIRLYMDANAAKGIIERSGISKIRHIDVNQLWIQEQCARKMVPAVKVDGTKNPSDLMTKHLVTPIMERHLEFLNIGYQEGRSEKAAKLHAVHKAKRKVNFEQGKEINSFDEQRPDHWGDRGQDLSWSRIHSTPRRAMFTPYKVPRGPGRKTKLRKIRTTEGTTAAGQRFKIVDDWTKPENSHRLLSTCWVGSTTFKVDEQEDIDLGGDYRRQRSRAIGPAAQFNMYNIMPASDAPKFSWADAQDSDDAAGEQVLATSSLSQHE